MNVVTFVHHRHDRLAEKVQAWIDLHPNFHVSHLALTSTEANHCVTLLGEETATPQGYRFRAIFMSTGMDDEGTETQLQRAIDRRVQADEQLEQLAQSGNRMGYMVVLLVRGESPADSNKAAMHP